MTEVGKKEAPGASHILEAAHEPSLRIVVFSLPELRVNLANKALWGKPD
jgi:hypothetical protein